MRVLLAEDEHELARALSAILEHEGYTVDVAHDGEEALWLYGNNEPDICVLDIMMPKLDGLSVLRELRAQQSQVPVLLLTAKSEIRDRVEGLDAGANDYLTKPFAAQELLARLRALTRNLTGPVPQFGDISLDAAASSLVCGEARCDLTQREYQMMEQLIAAQGAKISTEQFLRKLWGGMHEVESGVVWVNLSNLRKKLQRVGSTTKISALRGVGYFLEEDAQ